MYIYYKLLYPKKIFEIVQFVLGTEINIKE